MDLLLYVVCFLAGLFLGQFLPSYFREKGKNLATKEDIADITNKVEEIRTAHARQLQEESHRDHSEIERQNREHAMRVAAIEKRLEAHQEGYALWRKLVGNVHKPDRIGQVVLECQAWWEKHCLYLDESGRQAFYDAYNAANMHGELLQGDRSKVALDLIEKNWQKLMAAGGALVRGAALPPLAATAAEQEIVGVKQGSRGAA